LVITATIDTNVLISALLAPDSPAPPSATVRRATQGEFLLVISATTISEVRDKTAHKPFLVKRLSSENVEGFIAVLRNIAVVIPPAPAPPPAVTRDPKDDYLLDPRILDLVDHIVTGDKDLLELQDVRQDLILSPAAFLRLLDAERSPDAPGT
jgi:putative PIN family toxin of toxin-antitoxin system